MGRDKKKPVIKRELPSLESELSRIRELFKDTPGTYERFAKFIQTIAASYIYGSNVEIPALGRLFGERQVYDPRDGYELQWFIKTMSEWRVHYRSDLLNHSVQIQCINAVTSLSEGGLEIRQSTINEAGNGLFTTRSFDAGTILTRYGGYQSTLDVCECLGLSDEYRQYVLGVPGSDHVFDSQIGFTLGGEMGRWINTTADGARINVHFDFSLLDTQGPVIRASRALEKGEELFVDYGPKFRLIDTCIQCNWKTTSVMCQACEAPICGNACHMNHCLTHHY
jgi:hypothetical protein